MLQEKIKLLIFRQILVLQMKQGNWKGCGVYAVQVTNKLDINNNSLEKHSILKKFEDVFLA